MLRAAAGQREEEEAAIVRPPLGPRDDEWAAPELGLDRRHRRDRLGPGRIAPDPHLIEPALRTVTAARPLRLEPLGDGLGGGGRAQPQ